MRIGRSSSTPSRRSARTPRASPAVASPCSWVNSVRGRSSIFAVASMRSIRYRDMLAARFGPRTSMKTFAAVCARNTAACPAEFPPPTSATSARSHIFASSADAQYDKPVPFELAQARHRGPAIACAAGDDHGPGAKLPTVGQLHRQFARRPRLAAIQRRGLRRDQDLRAEFLCLHEGAAGERLTGDAGRKAEVIFDAGAGTRLAAERPAVENDHVQALRCRVHRGCEPGRTGAHDGDVEELIVHRRIEDPEAAGKRVFGRIAQHRTVGADHEHVGRGRAVLFEQRGAVMRCVDDMMGMRVAAQEILQAQQVGRLRRSDQHRPAGAGFDQRDPAQDQRAHDAFAQVRFGDDEGAQLFGCYEQRLDVFFRIRIHEPGLSGELSHFTRKIARSQTCDRNHVAQAVTLADGDRHPSPRRTCPDWDLPPRRDVRRARSGAPRRTGRCGRSPPRSAPETSGGAVL